MKEPREAEPTLEEKEKTPQPQPAVTTGAARKRRDRLKANQPEIYEQKEQAKKIRRSLQQTEAMRGMVSWSEAAQTA